MPLLVMRDEPDGPLAQDIRIQKRALPPARHQLLFDVTDLTRNCRNYHETLHSFHAFKFIQINTFESEGNATCQFQKERHGERIFCRALEALSRDIVGLSNWTIERFCWGHLFYSNLTLQLRQLSPFLSSRPSGRVSTASRSELWRTLRICVAPRSRNPSWWLRTGKTGRPSHTP